MSIEIFTFVTWCFYVLGPRCVTFTTRVIMVRLPVILSTLRPERLRPLDYIDLSDKTVSVVTFPSCGAVTLKYDFDKYLWPFPPNMRGFLYYHTPPKAPPLVGEIRFRIASHLDNFHDGEDLLSRDKTPWSISPFSLANRLPTSPYASSR